MRRLKISSSRHGLGALLFYRELIRNLVLKDLKLKYRDSALGFFWSLANPLLVILVYSFVFTRMLRVDVPAFPYFLMVGILPWNFFSQSLMMSTVSILDNASLIRKVWLPIEVFPIAAVFFNLVQYLLALAVLFPIAILFFRIPFSWSVVAFLPVLMLHVLFTLGLSFLASTATVFYRDVRHFTDIFLMLLFWLTPIVYDVRSLPESLRRMIYFNPVSFFIASYQDILYRQSFPTLGSLFALLFLSLSSLTLGYLLFYNYKVRFPEEV
ncbi:MAG: ABC transporter permease [Deltaproteobacteria bacterium]|nr:ABC transporter permease [Deltaproteobacteria bacterium]